MSEFRNKNKRIVDERESKWRLVHARESKCRLVLTSLHRARENNYRALYTRIIPHLRTVVIAFVLDKKYTSDLEHVYPSA